MFGMLMEEPESVEERIKRLKPTTLRVARVEHLQDVLRRVTEQSWKSGDLVMPTKDSGINQAYFDEPHIVLGTRSAGAHECDWSDTVEIATVDKDGDVVTAWVAPWKLITYVDGGV